MKNIHINNSYNIWSTAAMQSMLRNECARQLASYNPETALNRTYKSLYIEWWLHNIGYYVTKPLCFIKYFNRFGRMGEVNEKDKHKFITKTAEDR